MYQRKMRSSAGSASSFDAASAASAQAGQATSNQQMMAQLAGQQQEESTAMLDAVAGQGGRVTGQGKEALLAAMGESPWVVNSTQAPRTMDRMKVLKSASSPDGVPPDWYTQNADRNLGLRQIGQGYVHGGWAVLDSANGAYVCGYEDSRTGEYLYFMVDYQAPEPKGRNQRMRDQLLSEGGGMTAQYTAYMISRVGSGIVNFFNPADNLIQAATGRNLDTFSDDFGDELSVSDRILQVVQAAAESVGASELQGMTKLQKLALGLTVAAEAGTPVVIDALVDTGLIDQETAEVVLIANKLVGLMGVFANFRKNGKLETGDYLATVATLASGGEQAIKACLGEDGYEQFWKGNTALIGQYLQNADKIQQAWDLVSSGGAALKK